MNLLQEKLLNFPADGEIEQALFLMKEAAVRLTYLENKQRKYTEFFDRQLGTPCEQIRHQQEIERWRRAATPSEFTKAAFMGEFHVPLPEWDENGEEYIRQINVPWTTIKEIMKAIREYAGESE